MKFVSMTKSMRHAVVLDSKCLESLLAAANQLTPNCTIQITTTDDFEVTFESLENLICYVDTSEKLPIKLVITGSGRLNLESDSGERNYVGIQFGIDKFGNNISVHLTGDEEDVNRARSKILQLIRDSKPLWSFAAILEIIHIYLVLLFFEALALLMLSKHMDPGSHLSANQIYMLVLFVLATIAAFLIVLRRIQTSLFPLLEFTCGYGEKAKNRHDFWRLFVLAGIGVGVISSLIATFLTS